MIESRSLYRQSAVALLIGAAMIGGLCLPPEGRAEPPKGMMKKEMRPEHGSAMHEYVNRALHGLFRHQKDLGLSDDQVSKLKTVAVDYEKARIKGEADLKLAEVDVQTLIHNDQADLPTIEAALRKSESAHTVLRLEAIKAMRATVAVLTPEQREKWRASFSSRHGEGKDGGGYRDGGPAGQHGSPKQEG